MSVDLIKNKFDIKTFNKGFEDYMKQQTEIKHQQEIERLKQLNETKYEKKITEMTWNEIMVEWKTSIIGVLDDALHFRFTPSVLFRENRLFFIGITLLILAIIFYTMVLLFGMDYRPNEKTYKFTLDVPILNEINQQLKKSNQSEGFFSKLFKKKQPTETILSNQTPDWSY